jgi:hypothetical protein
MYMGRKHETGDLAAGSSNDLLRVKKSRPQYCCHRSTFSQDTAALQLHNMSMNYRAIDPRAYGIKIRSTPRASIRGVANDKETTDKDSGDSSRDSSSMQSSLATSTALETTSDPNQGVTQSIDGTRNEELLSSRTTTPPLSSTVARQSPRRGPATTDQKAKHELRWQRFKEDRKRRRRERLVEAAGHELDSDGEREYLQASYARFAAEEARRKALSPEARRQEDIESAAEVFRGHIKPRLAFDYAGGAHLQHYPLFLLQSAPDSPNGAKCRLRHCSDRIVPGQYRIAVSPGMWDSRGPGKVSSRLKHLPFLLRSSGNLVRVVPCRSY